MQENGKKYPCQAKITNLGGCATKDGAMPDEAICTVLSAQNEYGRYPVELPEGYAEAPALCGTWLARPEILTFLD